ncbi:HK97-gp10 family putative phage morphogenesis protein, partial [Escherichia coli]|uniref:HK97-gp10 family putative phage morphogenesis protein n=1 Tax=Escherichia coli TaxID=562 RepID=UPI002AC88436
KKLIMLPSETMIWQPEFTDKTLSRKPGAVHSDPRNAFYWRFVELGTINMPAHPFIRPAFDTTEELAAQIAIQRMNQAIDEVLSK